MPKIENNTKKITLLSSTFLAILLVVFGAINVGFSALLDDYIFVAILVIVIPTSILSFIDYRWRTAVNEHLPDLFRSIVQAQEVGMTLPQALEEAAKRDYGPLTSELQKITIQMSWGASFEESLLAFEKRVDTILCHRTIPMIIEASRSGGRVEQVFDPLSKFIETTIILEKERGNQTRPYIAIIYVALFVFLFTIIILFKTFFTDIEGVALFSMSTSSPLLLQRIFLHLTIVQGFFSGLVAGKMGEGTISAGLKHSAIMMIIGYMTLKFLL